MKKSLLFCGVAALAFASCTQSEVLDVNENRAIGFDAFSGKATRTVSDITGTGGGTFTQFNIYGSYKKSTGNAVNILTNEDVTYSSGWGYTNTQYWTDATYNFVAYSNGNAKIVYDEDENNISYTHDGGLTISNYNVATEKKDLVVATQTKTVSTEELSGTINPVELTFNHVLSKVKFTITPKGFPSYQTVKVTGLKITGSNTVGKFSSATSAWSEQGTPADIVYAEIANINTTYTPEECYVLPQSLVDGVDVVFTVTVNDGNTDIMTNSFTVDLHNLTLSEWKKGNAYNYTTEITPQDVDSNIKEIKFTVNETVGWITSGNNNEQSLD